MKATGRTRFLPFFLLLFVLITLLRGQADGSETATIEGVVPLPEAPPPHVIAQRYKLIAEGNVLSPVPPVGIIWLEGRFPPPEELPEVAIVQENLQFKPALLVVRPGTTLTFPNEDDEYHNVFSYSPGNRFDLGRYLPEERPVPSKTLLKPGTVVIRCDIHEHMRAVVLVVDTPHHMMTNPDGTFRMTNLPPGDFVLKAWVNNRTTLEVPVELRANKTTVVDFGKES